MRSRKRDARTRPSPHFETALRLHFAALGDEHPVVAVDRAAFAGYLLDRGRGEQARPLLERAHAVAMRVHGSEHELTKEIEALPSRLQTPSP